MRGKRDIGRAAEFGRVDMAELEIKVFGHRGRAGTGRVTAAEITVDVGTGQPGVGERAERHFGVKLRHRLVRRMPRRVLVGAGDIGLALDGHAKTYPPPRKRGRGTARSAVEGATAVRPASMLHVPSTMLRMVPLP